jgi:hypothetical protein
VVSLNSIYHNIREKDAPTFYHPRFVKNIEDLLGTAAPPTRGKEKESEIKN